jgi:hypothetical protein
MAIMFLVNNLLLFIFALEVCLQHLTGSEFKVNL